MPDQIIYEFTCQGLSPEASFSVIDFKGFEAISRPYQFTINLKSESPDIDMDAMLSSPCTLRMRIGRYERPVHGVLSGFEQRHQVDRFTFYRVVLVPKLWHLSLYQANEIYLNDQADRPGTDVPEILGFVLQECGLNPDIDYRMALNGSYPKHPYRCQWNETHFNYISRLMEHEGIYYYFEQGDDRERIVFCDLRQAHVPVEDPQVNYSPAAGLDIDEAVNNIHALVCQQKRMPRTVVLKDYNYEKPSLDVTGKAEVDPKGIGEVFRYGDNFETPEEGHRLAGIRAQEIFAGKERYFGESMVSRLLPGHLFSMRGHYREGFNQEYLLAEIRHEGAAPSYLTDAGEAEPISAYNNSFIAIPETVQFRPERITEKPRFHGQINAVVDGEASGKYAELDDQGRYKIRLPFDRENSHGPGKASYWFRKAEPHAGPNEGMHFPLRQRTEVLLSFIDGDPDRPLISSAVPNPATPNVVTGKNQTSNVIRTSAGNLMEFEDMDGRNRMKFSTPQNSTYLHLGAPNHPGDGIVGVTKGIHRLEIGGGKQHTFVTKDEYGNLSGTSKSSGQPYDAPSAYSADAVVTDQGNTYICVNDLLSAPQFSSTQTYSVGDIAFEDNIRYKCKTAIDTPGEFNSDQWDRFGNPDDTSYWTEDLFLEQGLFTFRVKDSEGMSITGNPSYRNTTPNPIDNMTEDDEYSGNYLIDRQIGPRYKWSKNNEYIFHYGGAIGTPSEKKIFEYGNTYQVKIRDSQIDSNITVGTTDILIADLNGSKDASTGTRNIDQANYNPSNIKDYYGKDRSWSDTIKRARVSLAEHDTITGQKGNIYDFGGYWNYNLGNSYEEAHINQDIDLNKKHELAFPSSGFSGSALLRTAGGAVGATVIGGIFLAVVGKSKNVLALVVGGIIMGALQTASAFIHRAVAKPGTVSGEEGLKDLVTSPADLVSGSKISGKHVKLDADKTWVTKTFAVDKDTDYHKAKKSDIVGGNYEYTKAHSISITIGDQEEHNLGDTYSYTYGGRHEEVTYNSMGVMTEWSGKGLGKDTWVVDNFEMKFDGMSGFPTHFEAKILGMNFEADFPSLPKFKFAFDGNFANVNMHAGPFGGVDINMGGIDAIGIVLKKTGFKLKADLDAQDLKTKIETHSKPYVDAQIESVQGTLIQTEINLGKISGEIKNKMAEIESEFNSQIRTIKVQAAAIKQQQSVNIYMENCNINNLKISLTQYAGIKLEQ